MSTTFGRRSDSYNVTQRAVAGQFPRGIVDEMLGRRPIVDTSEGAAQSEVVIRPAA